MTRTLAAGFFALTLVLVPIHTSLADAPAPASQPASGLNLIAFGDWGENSPHRQLVADTMARFVAAAPAPYDCALGLGDNFYVPIHGVNDPIFDSFFEKTYDANKLDFPFYFLPGNHDYSSTGGVPRWQWELQYAVAHPQSRWKMPARWYRLDLPIGHPLATILMLDSDKDNGGAPGNSLTPKEWLTELNWLNNELKQPHAPWLICCAHHTIYSNGIHGDNAILMDTWGLLLARYHVDLYVCGHDHSLQHLEIPGVSTSFVVSGGGGARTYAMLRDDRGPFFRSLPGFCALQFTPTQATVELIGMDGEVLHTFSRSKAGQVTIVQTTPSQKKTDQPLRYIQGYYDRPGTTQPATAP
jgi:tartrate-resistant acid phosphatase type 5